MYATSFPLPPPLVILVDDSSCIPSLLRHEISPSSFLLPPQPSSFSSNNHFSPLLRNHHRPQPKAAVAQQLLLLCSCCFCLPPPTLTFLTSHTQPTISLATPRNILIPTAPPYSSLASFFFSIDHLANDALLLLLLFLLTVICFSCTTEASPLLHNAVGYNSLIKSIIINYGNFI